MKEQGGGSSFFRFFLGFVAILFLSFGVTFAVNFYVTEREAQAAAAAQAILGD